MSSWRLPTSLTVSGVDFRIRTDFRVIVKLCQYLADPDYKDEAALICLKTIFIEFDQMPHESLQEALEQAYWFINGGISNHELESQNKPILMDWEQDANLIIPAVNKVAGKEIRAMDYLHWWTFLGYYQEIGESVFTTVIGIRSKQAKGKKLEKWEREYLRDNKGIVKLRQKMSEEERLQAEEEKRLLDELL